MIALNSVLRYKGREIDPQALGRELAVGAVAVGRVVPRLGALAGSAELVNVRDKSRMWGATYNRKMVDLLAIQEEIATSISDNLRLRLSNDAKKKLTKRYTDNIEAYQFSSIVLPPSVAIPKARAAAMKALEIDESLGEAHASLGIIKAQYDWDRAGAEKEFRRAIELNPNYASAHQWFGTYYFADGRFDQALTEFKQAQQLDPLSLIIAVNHTEAARQLGLHPNNLHRLIRNLKVKLTPRK